MDADELIDKVIDHDKHIDKLTNSIESLVEVSKNTNGKLDKLVDNIQNLALLTQKVENMDANLDESFKRVHQRADKNEKKIESLETSRNSEGCPAIKRSNQEIDVLNIAVFGKDGRGGLIYDVADIKKVMYKLIGWGGAVITMLNVLIEVYAK